MRQTCRICNNIGDYRHFACTERMFGMSGSFDYFQCNECRCVQICEIPDDIGRYYPPHYYSFHLQPFQQTGWKARLAGLRDRARLTMPEPFRSWIFRRHSARGDIASLEEMQLRTRMRILDLGCGRGQLLSILHRAGFRRLCGIDPYLAGDLEVVPGLVVRKLALESLDEEFDLIMLHHVFEHILDGQTTLHACRKILAPQGRILIRVPTAESAAWAIYRQNWVQLDAPRHFFLHTRRSLAILAEQTALEIDRIWCDSSSFQFWGSELYCRGVPLFDTGGRPASPEQHFSHEQLKEFEAKAAVLNRTDQGDQFVAILRSTRT